MRNKVYCVYAYFLNRRAVYVGHTKNLAKRDWEHTHYSDIEDFRIPFHRFMKETGGREKFSLKVLASAKTEKRAVLLENRMIKKFKTQHKFGGWNFCPAQIKFNEPAVYEAWKAALSKAWTEKRKRETSKRMIANNPSKKASVQKLISETIKKLWKDPNIRKAMTVNNPRGTGKIRTKSQRKQTSEYMKRLWAERKRRGLPGVLSKVAWKLETGTTSGLEKAT